MTFRIVQIESFRLDMQTRFPFRYGIASMTDLPHLVVRISAEVDGRPCQGVAADGLPPKWFTKNPDTSYEQDDLPAMLRSIRHASDLALMTAVQPTLFDWWWELYQAQAAWAKQCDVAPLLAGFGCSLIERAAMDAFCRIHQVPLATALRSGVMGTDLARLRSELSSVTVADVIPPHPNQSLILRHTVGLGDPLEDGEIGVEERLQDGLPHSLVQNIRQYGLRYFKIKLSGDLNADLDRMTTLQRILDRELGPNMRFTLDGNEQFKNFAAFRTAWEQLRSVDRIAKMLDDSLLFVEQPLHRDVALLDTVGEELRDWPDAPPIIIDESDGELESFPKALSLGYSGTSHKNCKGIFKSLATAATLQFQRQAGRQLILSAEDLGNVGPIALLQDLAVVAALGIEHVERNGHHYFAGLGQFPRPIQESLIADHPDLYHWHQEDFVALTVKDGSIQLGSVNRSPFGLRRLPDLSTLQSWDF